VTPELQGRLVLIVEDDEPTQKLLQAVLHHSGYATEIAADGAQAISRLEAQDFAVIVLDVMMPAVGGYEVVAYLARSGKRIPVVICSAAGPKALADFDPDVVKAVVRKPFDIEQLVNAVRSAIDSH
jgi:CheY-like chemotaxis protein